MVGRTQVVKSNDDKSRVSDCAAMPQLQIETKWLKYSQDPDSTVLHCLIVHAICQYYSYFHLLSSRTQFERGLSLDSRYSTTRSSPSRSLSLFHIWKRATRMHECTEIASTRFPISTQSQRTVVRCNRRWCESSVCRYRHPLKSLDFDFIAGHSLPYWF